MAIAHFGPDAGAAEIRGLSPAPPSVVVAEIIAEVAERGDLAVAEYERQFSDQEWPAVASPESIERALAELDPKLLAALKLAIENVRKLAEASLAADAEIELFQGQSVMYRQVPVRRVAAYVPGGRGSYPSTAIMCLATAAAAGVKSTCVLSPAREHGAVDQAVLAVCALLGVSEVYAIGGAQAIAAAALGTQTIDPVDVIVGPGSAYVQEAKRQLVGRVGIDSVAGPSELVVVADECADAAAIALDLLAQGEHGPDSLVVLATPDAALASDVAARCAEIEAELAVVQTADLAAAARLADEIAPEHLQLMVAPERQAELAASISRAGALFVGHHSATAFGDYVIGSNHVLPTGGSARFSSALSVSTFRRRMAEIHVPAEAAAKLADAGATLARGEGFVKHAESMEARR